MTIKCEERYQEAMDYAEKTNDKSLQNCLDSLKRWEANGNSEIILYKDFAPYSFYFEEMKDGNRIMNGGLLYHGNPDQSYAVQLVSSIGWSIHT